MQIGRIASVPITALLISAAVFAVITFTPVVSASSCSTTYKASNYPESGPMIPITITSSGTYCFTAGTYNTQITVTANSVVLTTAPGTHAGQVIIEPTTVTWNAVNPDDQYDAPSVPAIIYASAATALTGVTVEGLTVDGSGAAAAVAASNPCAADGNAPSDGCYFGILFLGTSGEIVNSIVNNMNTPTTPSDGLGIQVGTTVEDGISSSVTISGNAVTNYAKNGITCDGALPPTTITTTCTISDNRISPLSTAGATTATNGIQLALATGTISGNTVTGNVYSGATSDQTTQSQATGIVTDLNSEGVLIFGNTLTHNDDGIEEIYDTGPVTSTSNVISDSTFAGIVVYDESQTVSHNTFSSEPVGIEAVSDNCLLLACSPVTATVTVRGNTFSSVTLPTTTETTGGGIAQIDIIGELGYVSTTTVFCSYASVTVGSSVTCTATVTGYGPTGTVTWSQRGSGSVSFTPGMCSLSSGSCSVKVTGSKPGSLTITAAYSGDSNNLGGSGTAKLTITKA